MNFEVCGIGAINPIQSIVPPLTDIPFLHILIILPSLGDNPKQSNVPHNRRLIPPAESFLIKLLILRICPDVDDQS